MPKTQYKKGDKKVLRAWAFYDWANSVYALVISTAIFPLYFGSLFEDNQYVEVFGINYKNTALIQHTTTLVFICLAIACSPTSQVFFIIGVLEAALRYIGAKFKSLNFGKSNSERASITLCVFLSLSFCVEASATMFILLIQFIALLVFIYFPAGQS